MATVDVQREEKAGSVKFKGGVADFGNGIYRRFNFRSVALVLDRLSPFRMKIPTYTYTYTKWQHAYQQH
jgi:hypothetical protein